GKARHLDAMRFARGSGTWMHLAACEDIADAVAVSDQIVHFEAPVGRASAQYRLHVLLTRQTPRPRITVDYERCCNEVGFGLPIAVGNHPIEPFSKPGHVQLGFRGHRRLPYLFDLRVKERQPGPSARNRLRAGWRWRSSRRAQGCALPRHSALTINRARSPSRPRHFGN